MTLSITYENWDEQTVHQLNDTFQDSLDVLKWAYQTYANEEIVYACSFGAEGMVLIDLISKVNPFATIVFLDTDLHFKETYTLINEVQVTYPQLTIKLVKPHLTLEEQAEQFGDELWESDPNKCCHIRKVKPLRHELSGVTAWISGLRREQSASRRHTNYLNHDQTFSAIKICPLIHWTWKEIWQYILLHNLPYNILHDQGYPSIGCEKCTLPVTDGEDSRSGRWAQFKKTECGLHPSS